MIEPVQFRFNPETAASNAFQVQAPPDAAQAAAMEALAPEQHRQLRDLLIANGVLVTACRSLTTTPDAPFCNNWFSTHLGDEVRAATLVLYPLLSANRRLERRADLVDRLGPGYPRLVDFGQYESETRYLESTGSLCLDHANGIAYAAISPRTDHALAGEWARQMEFTLVAFHAVDAGGTPYYHTNVMMFVGHGIAGVVLDAIADPDERLNVECTLAAGGNEVLAISRDQAAHFCGNCLALANDRGEALLVMSSAAYHAFSPAQRSRLETKARLLHTDLSAFESLAGGSARCLLAELF